MCSVCEAKASQVQHPFLVGDLWQCDGAALEIDCCACEFARVINLV
jgi:hypothetical protein